MYGLHTRKWPLWSPPLFQLSMIKAWNSFMANSINRASVPVPKVPDFYDPQPHEVAFFKQQTGIQDDELLKQHIIQVQAKAYKVHLSSWSLLTDMHAHFTQTFCRLVTISVSFASTSLISRPIPCPVISRRSASSRNETGLSCSTLVVAVSSTPSLSRHLILSYHFTSQHWCEKSRLRRLAYPRHHRFRHSQRSEQKPVHFLECCLIYSSDFWEYGHQLFKSTPQTFPVAFIPGDVFDPAFISQRGPFLSMADVKGSVTPPLNTLSSLIPLQGKISAIHMSSFFHLFSEDRQLQLAKIVSSLLSPEKGSVIFGQHVGMPAKGLRVPVMYSGLTMFCHSPESWTQMWVEDVFGGEDKDGNVKVKMDTELVSLAKTGLVEYPEEDIWFLNWSVTRIWGVNLIYVCMNRILRSNFTLIAMLTRLNVNIETLMTLVKNITRQIRTVHQGY